MFFVGDVAQGGGEPEGGGFTSDLGAECGSEGDEAGGGNVGQVALGEFVLDAAQAAAELFPSGLAGGEVFFGDGLEFDGLEVLDLECVLAAPTNERWLGNFDRLGDAVEGPALGPEGDEFTDGFLVVHFLSF